MGGPYAIEEDLRTLDGSPTNINTVSYITYFLTAQNRVHRLSDSPGDVFQPPYDGYADSPDGCFRVGGRAMRGRARPARAVEQPRVALSLPPPNPLVGGRPRDPHLPGHMSDRAAGTDTLDQQPPAMNSQPGITVGHEDLRVVQS